MQPRLAFQTLVTGTSGSRLEICMPRILGNAVRLSRRLPHPLHTRYLCLLWRVGCGKFQARWLSKTVLAEWFCRETILEHFAGSHGTPGASLYSRGLAFRLAYRPLPHPHPEELQPPPNPNTPWVALTTLSPQPLRQSTLLIPHRRLPAPFLSQVLSKSGSAYIEHSAFRDFRTLKCLFLAQALYIGFVCA